MHCSQELYQATDETYQTLSELEAIFPTSAFLKTQRALLYYHSKGMSSSAPPTKLPPHKSHPQQISKMPATYSQKS